MQSPTVERPGCVSGVGSVALDSLRTGARSAGSYAVAAETVSTALTQALVDNDVAMIRALEPSAVEREAALFSSHPGLTPLLWACGHCSAAVVKALLDVQCDATAVSPAGHSALMLAVCSPHREAEHVVTELLGHPTVNALAADPRQINAFQYACEHGQSVRIVDLLLQHATSQSPRHCAQMTEAVSADGATALMASVVNKHDREADILKLLLYNGLGVQIGARDKHGATAFHRACGHAASPTHVAELVRAGADPNAIDTNGATGLMYAARNRNVDVLWHLLGNSNVEPSASDRLMQILDATDDKGWTALHFACDSGCTVAVDLLVTACCNVTATTHIGQTALMLAAACPDGTEACRSLLEWNSEGLELRDAEGRTARDLAAAAGHTAATRLLDEKEAEALREGVLASNGSSPPPRNAYESGMRADLMVQTRATGLTLTDVLQPEPQLQPMSTPRPRPQPVARQSEPGQQSVEEGMDEDSELRKAIELSAMEEQLHMQRQQLEQVQLEQAIAESQIAHAKLEAAREAAKQQRQQREAVQREAAQVNAERREAAARRDNAATVRRIAEQHEADEKQRQQMQAQEKQRQAEQMRSRLDSAFAKFQQRRQAREGSSPKGDAEVDQKQQNASEKLEAALAKMRKKREAKQIATGKQVNVTREALEKEARRLFNRVDEDRSGHLDADEVKELARLLKLHLSEEEAQIAMEKMDADGNGTVDFDEFFGWYVDSIE